MQAPDISSIEWPKVFANVVIGKLDLLIPQSDIYSLEPAVDMIPSRQPSGSIGQIEQEDNIWSLYGFSEDLTLLDRWIKSYRIAILMKNVDPVYGLLCEQVYTLERSSISIHPLPPAMLTENSPLLALALNGEQVRCISSAKELTRLVKN
jgi:hypothetical protein